MTFSTRIASFTARFRGAFRPAAYLVLPMIAAVVINGCASSEKRVDLTYQTGASSTRSSSEIYLAKSIVKNRLPKLPGGRVILGTVKGSFTRIVTSDDVQRWVQVALMEELFAAGYEVMTVPTLPNGVSRGVMARLERLSVNQESDGLLLRTSTDIGLAVEICKNGRLAKTLTVSGGQQDQGLDRSGIVVSSSLEATLRTAFGQLMPAIVKNLQG